MQFSFVTSKPGIKTDADKQLLANLGVTDVMVIGIPTDSGAPEQPFGVQTEGGATGRLNDLNVILVHLRNDTLPENNDVLKGRVEKARKMIESQIADTDVTLAQVLNPENTHSKVSFENGMLTIKEAQERNVASTKDGTDLRGVTYIDTCAVVIEMPDGIRTTGFDAGLPIPSNLTHCVEKARQINSQLTEAERPNGTTATKCMIEAGRISVEFSQDPHKGRDPNRPRSLYLSEAGTAVMREASLSYLARKTLRGLENNFDPTSLPVGEVAPNAARIEGKGDFGIV